LLHHLVVLCGSAWLFKVLRSCIRTDLLTLGPAAWWFITPERIPDSNCLCDLVPIQCAAWRSGFPFKQPIGDQLLGHTLGLFRKNSICLYSVPIANNIIMLPCIPGEAPCSTTHLHSGRPSLLSFFLYSYWNYLNSWTLLSLDLVGLL